MISVSLEGYAAFPHPVVHNFRQYLLDQIQRSFTRSALRSTVLRWSEPSFSNNEIRLGASKDAWIT
jgi:hypothetical protein